MICPDIGLLAAYVDENVTADEQRLVDAHLSDCERCLDLVACVIASKIVVPDSDPSQKDEPE